MLSAAPFFTGVGDLPGGDFFSRAYGVSNDGTVVVGQSINANDNNEAFRWTRGGGMQPLGFVDGATTSYGNSASNDGSTIVGYSPNGTTPAFVWTEDSGVITPLPTLPGATNDGGSAFDVASDGGTIAGYAHNGVTTVATGWRRVGTTDAQYAPQELGYLPSSSGGSLAYGVSDDGSVAVGYGVDSQGVAEAFRWTEATGMVGLGSLGDSSGKNLDSRALRVSADGNVIVGQSNTAQKIRGDYVNEAFRWTEATGMVGLGDLPGGGVYSRAAAVSGDGSYVVGQSSTDAGNEAFIWNAVHGMRSLQDVLTSDYQLEITGWQLTHVIDITADGLTVVGEGINPEGLEEGWIAHLGTVSPQPGITVDPALGLETNEDGTTASFDVVLQTQPIGDVTIEVDSSDVGEGTVNKSNLTFTSENWNVGQTVVVQGVDDADQDGDQTYTIRLDPSPSSDPDYQVLGVTDVSVTNLDNESPPASSNDIYVWDIYFEQRTRGSKHDARIFADVHRDSDANGLATGTDDAATGVAVTVDLREAGADGLFETADDNIIGTISGTTDSAGIFRSSWIRDLPHGTYRAEVVDLAHATFNWNQLFTANDDDEDDDGLPDDIFTIPA